MFCRTFVCPSLNLDALQAGRLPDFDSLASRFLVATGDARNTIFKEASILATNAGATSKHYLRVMEKVVNGTEAYLEKESKRYAPVSIGDFTSSIHY